MDDLDAYFGPPTRDEYCVRQYKRPDLRCPNEIEFYVKTPDGRTSWRKGWPACYEHLTDVIWQMYEATGTRHFELLFGGTG